MRLGSRTATFARGMRFDRRMSHLAPAREGFDIELAAMPGREGFRYPARDDFSTLHENRSVVS